MRRVSRSSLPALAALTATLSLCLVVAPRGHADGSEGALVAEPVLGSAAQAVKRLIGASPLEAPGEVWGLDAEGGRSGHVVRYTDAGGWETLPGAVDAGGQPVGELTLAPGALAGRTTPAGGLALLAKALGRQQLILRDPGGGLKAVGAPEPALLLSAKRLLEYNAKATEVEREAFFQTNGEEMYGTAGTSVKLAAVEEAGGGTGAFVVPVPKGSNAQDGVLHFDGGTWSRERICLKPAPSSCESPTSTAFRVIAVDTSGPGNAWLLTKGAASGDGIELFAREGGEWRPRPLGGSYGSLFAKSPAPGLGVSVVARENAQPLTVTSTGVWVDATLAGSEKVDATIYYDIGSGQVLSSWCDLQGTAQAMCKNPLGSDLPSAEGRSFAWPSEDPALPYGKRSITGVGQGAMLILEGGSFSRVPLLGGNVGAGGGAALSAPDEGWLGCPQGPLRLTRQPGASSLQSWPVPFRRPLTAIAGEPGAPVGALSSGAIAVGDDGQVARYVPGQGWQPEALLSGTGSRARPRLRGVAWPTPGSAFAVGDEGAMWLWRAATGLWEPDPGAPPNLIRGNFTGVAFDPTDPGRGYAVGRQGLLLSYGRSWVQESLPAGVSPEANFTSVAFAGHEALAAYRVPVPNNGGVKQVGGLLVNDGSGWRTEAVGAGGSAPRLVAGLPDGGAIASVGEAIAEREGEGAPWRLAPLVGTGTSLTGASGIAGLAAIREGGQVRALVIASGVPLSGSLAPQGGDSGVTVDEQEQVLNQPPAGQAPLLIDPSGLGSGGYLLRQTANGWRDEQQVLPVPSGSSPFDLPRNPEPLQALLVAPDGSAGWAVGGETGEKVSDLQGLAAASQTAAVMRYGTAAAAPANAAERPIPTKPDLATFALGGNAQCANRCADLGGTGIGPDVWLRSAVAKAGATAGVRAFLYTGTSVPKPTGQALSRNAFAAEEGAYARRLSSAASALPIYAAPSESDLGPSGSLESFATAFAGHTPIPSAEMSRGYYSFDSAGTTGTVRVVVLDYSAKTLNTARNHNEQLCWLAQQLSSAKQAEAPAIVVGSRDLSGQVPTSDALAPATDAATVVPVLVTGRFPAGCPATGPEGGASAYFFDFREQNRSLKLVAAGRSIPAFGSGTLGYLKPPISTETDFVGASGFLLASVDVDARVKATNVAPVTARLIPSIGELAVDAADGTLLRRSRVALFRGLARRPRAGQLCGSSSGLAPAFCEDFRPDPYIPIPAQCSGPKCASGLFPEYRFASSNPDIADFVRTDPTSLNPRRVLLTSAGKTIPSETSGLLCAFNAGTTTVTLEAGGLAYSVPVTVQRGSVQRPCGTVPLRNPPSSQPQLAVPPPPPAPAPAPGFNSPPGTLPPPPPPAAPTSTPTPPHSVHHLPHPPPQPVHFFAPSPTLTPVLAIVPPPPPPAAQTTPPSGTSPVTQPVTAPEPEREEEVAFDLVHHMAAYPPAAPRAILPATAESSGGGFSALYCLPALIMLAALGGAGITGSRRRSPQLAYAPQPPARRPRR